MCIKIQNCLDRLSFALWCSIDYILKLMKKMTDNSTFCNQTNLFYFYISVFVYRAGINVKNESSKQIFLYVIYIEELRFEHALVVHKKSSTFTVTRGIISS